MADRHTLEELITIVLMMQGQLDTLNENIERLIEQVRIANSYRFGKHTETLDGLADVFGNVVSISGNDESFNYENATAVAYALKQLGQLIKR